MLRLGRRASGTLALSLGTMLVACGEKAIVTRTDVIASDSTTDLLDATADNAPVDTGATAPDILLDTTNGSDSLDSAETSTIEPFDTAPDSQPDTNPAEDGHVDRPTCHVDEVATPAGLCLDPVGIGAPTATSLGSQPPPWEPVEFQVFVGPMGTFTSFFCQADDWERQWLEPNHRFDRAERVAAPKLPHAPPYAGELGRTLDAAGVCHGQRVAVDALYEPMGVWFGVTLAPTDIAPTGRTADYETGPFIADGFEVDGDLYRDGGLVDAQFDFQYPPATAFDASVSGWSHAFIIAAENDQFLRPQTTGDYLFKWRISNAAADWEIAIPFRVDVGSPGICSDETDQCAAGYKCTQYYDGAEQHIRCVPVASNPKHEGEACNAEPETGLDNCDKGLYCWDWGSNHAVCLKTCTGSSFDGVGKTCDSDAVCSFGSYALCVPKCDPLDETPCAYPNHFCRRSDSGDWLCAGSIQPLPGPPTAVGGDCSAYGECGSGLTCVAPFDLPGICPAGAGGCCAQLCDTAALNSGCPEQQRCMQPTYATPQPPPEYRNVGICRP